ncbi:DUF3857 and transglutaminase domain-containing protein [Microscilla marina]|nr:DUF3857 and transglutaminase domain-containing protein [Microscilla marina]
MRNLTLLFMAIFVFVINTNAQQKVKAPKVRLGKIDKKWLEMKVYPKDSNATAVILYDKGETSIDTDDLSVIHTRHVRVKIINKAGYKWSNVQIPYYISGIRGESVRYIRGYTYNLVNDKIVKQKFDPKTVLTQKLSKYWKQKTMAFSKVKEGSVIEYTYTIKSKDFRNLKSWYFQKSIPVAWSEYKVEVPNFVKYNVASRGYLINYSIRRITETKASGMNSQIPVKTTHYHWAVKDLPAIKKESYITILKDYTPGIEFRLNQVNIPNGASTNYYTNWATANNQLLTHENFGAHLKFNTFLDEVANSIRSKYSDTTQRVVAAYQHIQSYMTWNKKKRIFVYEPLDVVYRKKTGNATAINFLLVSLLRKLGIKTDPVVLSTRSHGKIKPSSSPMINRLNYMIAQIKLNSNTTILADATDPLLDLGTLPYRCLNGLGRSVNNQGGSWIFLGNTPSSTQVGVEVTLAEDGTSKAVASVTQKGFNAYDERKKLHQQKPQKYAEKFWKGSEYAVTSHKFQNSTNIYKPLTAKYTLDLKEDANIKKAGNMFYITPIVAPDLHENPFKPKTRQLPIDFGYTFKQNYLFTLKIPKGYEVESMPKQKVVSLPKRAGRLIYIAQKQKDKVQVIIRFAINKPVFLASEYLGLRELYNQMIDKVQEQIVLKKI